MKLIMLTDYRRAFYSSTRNNLTHCSMDVLRLTQCFASHGVDAHVMGFCDVDFRADWSGKVVLYQSSEDPGLDYRSYIEDVVLGLETAGALVIPSFRFLRAHHNKVFMEILRQVQGPPEANTLGSKGFGTYEDYAQNPYRLPAVIKSASGAGSSGVRLLRTPSQALRVARRMSWCGWNGGALIEFVRRLVRRGYVPYSLHRRKFIVQDFVPGLAWDFKVLLYGSRVFVVRREVREDDFRASGSGLVSWPQDVGAGLLDFAWTIYRCLDVPHASFDVAQTDGGFHLIEAQFVSFGPLTVEKSPHHWERCGDAWELRTGATELEACFAAGVAEYMRKKAQVNG